MTASRATVNDVDWIIDLLSERRMPLVQHAPVFWRPAPDARATHRAFVEYLPSDGGAHAYRTTSAVLIAVPRGDGWLVDDAHVADQQWSETSDGHELWDLLAADCGGAPARFVCPTYENGRAAFAPSVGLAVQESWWLKELSSFGGQVGVELELPGAAAVTVGAPPVYAPPGPIMFLPNPTNAVAAVPAAIEKGMELGCAAVVVNQHADDSQLGEDLNAAGLRRHCDFFTGRIQQARPFAAVVRWKARERFDRGSVDRTASGTFRICRESDVAVRADHRLLPGGVEICDALDRFGRSHGADLEFLQVHLVHQGLYGP